MAKLLRMKKGDVMNINVDELVDFFVDSQNYFKGEMGEIKEMLVFQYQRPMV